MTRTESINAAYNNYNERLKKYFSKVTDSTKRMNAKGFVEIISDLLAISMNESKIMIESSGVSVNGDIVKDINYELKSGDVVRADIGRVLPNSGFMCVIN